MVAANRPCSGSPAVRAPRMFRSSVPSGCDIEVGSSGRGIHLIYTMTASLVEAWDTFCKKHRYGFASKRRPEPMTRRERIVARTFGAMFLAGPKSSLARRSGGRWPRDRRNSCTTRQAPSTGPDWLGTKPAGRLGARDGAASTSPVSPACLAVAAPPPTRSDLVR